MMRTLLKIRMLWPALLLAAMFLLPPEMRGQTDIERFHTAMRSLKGLQRYGYKVNLSGVMPDGSYDAVELTMYMDKGRKQVAYTDKANIVIINTRHIMHIDHNAKVFKIFDRKAYESRYNGQFNTIKGLFRDDDFNRMIDSLFLKTKHVQLSRDKSGHTQFGMTTIRDDMRMQLEFRYDEQRKLPVSMDMTLGSTGRSDRFVYTYKVSDYVYGFDDRVFDTRSYFTYADNTYTVLQYRDYKLISGL